MTDELAGDSLSETRLDVLISNSEIETITVKQKRSPQKTNVLAADSALQRYLRDINKIPLLSETEEVELIARAQGGDEGAASKLISSHLRFVVKVAREYQSRGLQHADLISEGNLGLIRALETFDPTKGNRFITYAVWWIRQSILQAIYNKSGLVRLPQSQQGQARNGNHSNGGQKQNDHPTPESQMKEEATDRLDSLNGLREGWLSYQSLDTPFNGDSADSLIDVLPDESALSPELAINMETLRNDLRGALVVLEPGERRCLELLYALGGEAPLTIEEVAAKLAIPKERVRQIRAKALVKLRRDPKVATSLLEYLE